MQVHVGQVRVPVEQRLCVDAGEDGRVRHDLPVDLGPDLGFGGDAGSGQRPGEHVIDRGVVEFADIAVGNWRNNRASRQVVEEAESVWPVRRPAADDQAEVMLVHVVRHAGEVGEESGRWVPLQGHVDPGAGEGLLLPGSCGFLLWLVGVKGHGGAEAVGLAAGRQFLLRLGHVTVWFGSRLVEVERLVAGQFRGQHRAGDVPAGDRPAVGALEDDLVRCVLNGAAAVYVVQRLHLGVDEGEPRQAGEGVVGVFLQRRAGQDLGPRGRPDTGPGQIEVGEVVDQVLIDAVGVDVQVDHDLVGELAAVGIGGRVPVRVLHQDEPLVQLVALELVGAGGDRVQLVAGSGVLGGRNRHRLR